MFLQKTGFLAEETLLQAPVRGRAKSRERGFRQLTVDIRQTGSPKLKGGPH